VCGTRDERHQAPPFDQLIRTFRLNGRAHYLGHLDDVVPALTACECVVIATHSTLREGLSQTAIDAMACGTPIAAYGLSGVTEVAGENDPAAMLARPDDVRDLSGALIKLLQDPKLAENIAQRGLIRVREFDPATMASRYERLFTELIAAPPPA